MSKDNSGIDYKRKYQELRARFIQSLDMAHRAGYEQGFNEATNQAMAQQAAQQAQAAAAMAGQGMPAGGPNPPQQGASDQSQDEMGMAISELEQLVNKSENLSLDDLKKSVSAIKSSLEHKSMLKKTQSIKTVFSPSQSFKVNLPEDSKAAVSMQTKIVDDILRKWEQEEQEASKNITQILGTEALTKKED